MHALPIVFRDKLALLKISQERHIRTREEFDISGRQECSKKSVQQGRSTDARSVHLVREHGKRARTPLAAFFNIPKL